MRRDLIIAAALAIVLHALLVLLVPSLSGVMPSWSAPQSDSSIEVTLVAARPRTRESPARHDDTEIEKTEPEREPERLRPETLDQPEPEAPTLPLDEATVDSAPDPERAETDTAKTDTAGHEDLEVEVEAITTPGEHGDSSISATESEGVVRPSEADYLDRVRVTYPVEAKIKGYEGRVLLGVEVLASGRVGVVEILESSGHEVLDRAAVRGVRRARFLPATRAGIAVATRVRLPVVFRLEER